MSDAQKEYDAQVQACVLLSKHHIAADDDLLPDTPVAEEYGSSWEKQDCLCYAELETCHLLLIDQHFGCDVLDSLVLHYSTITHIKRQEKKGKFSSGKR